MDTKELSCNVKKIVNYCRAFSILLILSMCATLYIAHETIDFHLKKNKVTQKK